MAKEIVNALITWENAWENENGPVEEYRRSKLHAASTGTKGAINRHQRRKMKSLANA